MWLTKVMWFLVAAILSISRGSNTVVKRFGVLGVMYICVQILAPIQVPQLTVYASLCELLNLVKPTGSSSDKRVTFLKDLSRGLNERMPV